MSEDHIFYLMSFLKDIFIIFFRYPVYERYRTGMSLLSPFSSFLAFAFRRVQDIFIRLIFKRVVVNLSLEICRIVLHGKIPIWKM